MEAKEQVYEALKNSDKPLKASEVEAITGVSAKEVGAAIKALVKEERAESPKRCFYTAK